MSGGLDVLAMREEDVLKFLAANSHLGTTNCDFQMEQYVYKRKNDGIFILNLKKTWEKLLLAARAIVAIENPADVCVISSRPYGQLRLSIKLIYSWKTVELKSFSIIKTIKSYVRLFCQAELRIVWSPLNCPLSISTVSCIPCAPDLPLSVPCYCTGAHSIGLMWWMLAREVLRLRGTIGREHPWDIMPDLYFYRDPEEIEKEEQAAAEKAAVKEPEYQGEWAAQPTEAPPPPEVADWAAEAVPVPSVPVTENPTSKFKHAASVCVAAATWGFQATMEDWTAAPTAQTEDWGGATADWS
uniref:Ribosomal protein SA n=1 Tax=Petromyzon marinus TaxID=7757 RepID=S4RCI2_PETMA